MPVYTEKDLLAEAVKLSDEALSRDFTDHEIILIDDGSAPEEGTLMDSLANQNERLTVIHNLETLNIGISLQKGLLKAKNDILVYNSVDLPLSPDDIGPLTKELGNNDLLVLQRRIYAGATLWRKITSKINYLLLKALFPFAGAGIRDFNYTFLIKREILGKIMPLSKSPAFTQPEIILRARYNKLSVITRQTDYHARKSGKGSLGKPRDILWSLYDMFRFRFLSFPQKLVTLQKQ